MWSTASTSLLMKAGAASSVKRGLHTLLLNSRRGAPLLSTTVSATAATKASACVANPTTTTSSGQFSEMQQRTGLVLLAHCCQSAAATATPTSGGAKSHISASTAWRNRLVGHRSAAATSMIAGTNRLLRSSPSCSMNASFVDFVAATTSSLRMSQRGTSTTAQEKKTETAEDKEKKTETAQDNTADKEREEENEKKGEGGQEAEEPRKSFFQQVREDVVQYPDIYNSINGMHFVLFLVFCLVSTASPSEDSFWKNQLSVSDKFRPLAWWVHSIVTENFMAMAYSMMMLHKLIIQMIAVWGLKRVQTFVLLTSGISGAVMWAGNYGYYQLYKKGRAEKRPEFQYGPWDVMYALLLAQYLHVAINPIRSILSFDHWLKYASAVGTLYIWYFDWQPTVVGALVGLVLCKTVPAFKVMPKVAA